VVGVLSLPGFLALAFVTAMIGALAGSCPDSGCTPRSGLADAVLVIFFGLGLVPLLASVVATILLWRRRYDGATAACLVAAACTVAWTVAVGLTR
jgi:hypothetical protein